ncbi:MAG: 23S rRNA (uracil(1939)-C(5))-methyltransferase RlmD, partial [Proteobacteria bacterium]|nr:23S rRNA (uracil(1939)-C(5))-methyltransferase RlmD [Pseudomonadota bacterium]
MTDKSVHANSVVVESLDYEGRGIAHADGKVIFIEGALTGERVTYSSYRKKTSFEIAQLGQVIKQTFMRVQPKCKHFGVCGGCSMQHMDARAQVAAKQRILEDSLWHIGKVKAQTMLLPIYGQSWGYRQRARLSVRHVLKKGKTLVGFREKRGGYVADMQHCEILTPKIAKLLPLLGQLNECFATRDALPQIEVAVGEHVEVLVLRILQALSPADEEAIKQFADTHAVQFWLQTKGPETAVPFYPLDAPPLTYSLPEFGITMPFAPTEFTQVNADMNRVMVSRAMRLLNPQPNERIADLFCGLGNFTLPIARSGAQAVGIEGSAALVQRAVQNAAFNDLSGNTQFSAMNLFEIDEAALVQLGHFDKILIDPPRDGAFELVKALGTDAPGRIVY